MLNRLADRWDVIILGGARDFHAMDWFRAVRRIAPTLSIVFVTDSFEAEGFKDLSQPDDRIEPLFIIDAWLFGSASRLAHLWRNLVKLFFAPIQAFRLRKYVMQHGCPIVHAHPMYFMLLAKMAGVRYVGTPQGDELLVRPKVSRLYRNIARWLLRGCDAVIVDSEQMKAAARDIACVEARVIQNGINVLAIEAVVANKDRFRILSIRGFTELYRISEIITARDIALPDCSLTFIYPFSDPDYARKIRHLMNDRDEDLGRQEKVRMYNILKETLLVVSIPWSDSSPRSVYESIFSGCCVVTVLNPWIEALPACMLERVFVIDLNDPAWLANAYYFALEKAKQSFVPSAEALSKFDEELSLLAVVDEFYAPQTVKNHLNLPASPF